ncbi:ribonuclease P protein component [Ottowia thiooxydans]|uniref:ribonuclease P protein component n=1 Tax=Ottowia thiooxydans TaxID=219182 RepID=UPI00041405B4|nr:ribonuclease P protein component [Ottowia thiooxydans]
MLLKHLRVRPQFQALLAGRAIAHTSHFALHRLSAARLPGESEEVQTLFLPSDAAWVGAMVPKRWARRAVTRNTIRRQIYAVAEELAPPLTAGAHLVRLRSAFAPAQFPSATSEALKKAVRAELNALFARAGV